MFVSLLFELVLAQFQLIFQSSKILLLVGSKLLNCGLMVILFILNFCQHAFDLSLEFTAFLLAVSEGVDGLEEFRLLPFKISDQLRDLCSVLAINSLLLRVKLLPDCGDLISALIVELCHLFAHVFLTLDFPVGADDGGLTVEVFSHGPLELILLLFALLNYRLLGTLFLFFLLVCESFGKVEQLPLEVNVALGLNS